MRGTNGRSRYTVPFSIKPDLGQVAENFSHPPSKQSCDVLHDDESGFQNASGADNLAPQSASCARYSLACPCTADVLAGESSADDINSPINGWFWWEVPHVSPAPDVRPVFFEDSVAVVVDFDLPFASHSRPLEAEIKAPNTGKQRTKAKHDNRQEKFLANLTAFTPRGCAESVAGGQENGLEKKRAAAKLFTAGANSRTPKGP